METTETLLKRFDFSPAMDYWIKNQKKPERSMFNGNPALDYPPSDMSTIALTNGGNIKSFEEENNPLDKSWIIKNRTPDFPGANLTGPQRNFMVKPLQSPYVGYGSINAVNPLINFGEW